MKVNDTLPNLFARWIQSADIQRGEVKVPVEKLVHHFRAFLASQNSVVPLSKSRLGRLLSARFYKVAQRRVDKPEEYSQHYYLNRDF